MPRYIKRNYTNTDISSQPDTQMPILAWTQKVCSKAQAPLPPNDAPKLDKKGIKHIQQILSSILYYTRAADMTILMALSSIAIKKMKVTEKNNEKMHTIAWLPCHQWKSKDKISHFENNFEYSFWRILPLRDRSPRQSMLTFFHGLGAKRAQTNIVKRCVPSKLNNHEICGGVCYWSQICCFVFIPQLPGENIFWQSLDNLGHPQPKTPVHCNNETAAGIANKWLSISDWDQWKWYVWVGDKVAQDMYKLTWHSGIENLADYQSKHRVGFHHATIRPYYLHKENSPRMLPRALRPSTLKGCIGTLDGGYIHNVPLTRIPRLQSAT